MNEEPSLFYYLAEAVQLRYCDTELAKFLNPTIIRDRRELRDTLLAFIHELEEEYNEAHDYSKPMTRINLLYFSNGRLWQTETDGDKRTKVVDVTKEVYDAILRSNETEHKPQRTPCSNPNDGGFWDSFKLDEQPYTPPTLAHPIAVAYGCQFTDRIESAQDGISSSSNSTSAFFKKEE